MDSNTVTLLMVVAALLVAYWLCSNESAVEIPVVTANQTGRSRDTAISQVDTSGESDYSIYSEDMEESEESSSVSSDESGSYFQQAGPSDNRIAKKFISRNKAVGGYKASSYNDGKRGDLGASSWDKYFDQNNQIIGAGQSGNNDSFMPIDESGGNLAVFKSKGGPVCGSNQNCQPEDLFDVDKYLPQEVNDDWFEVQPEPISVKNRHLINITKPIGVNTIGTSMKNSSYDIRGGLACPKRILSPFLNSNIEADQNLKPLF